ncbi:MAG: winged helix-turn-helix domain-containing protein [Candidatus Nitrosopolaris sp.]|jgi:predicted transcriptional regulator|nr:winged helix-turn-helix domain-containing protein [Candidatus Bathyarchaeia archaeon]HYA83340.1 winged helix-turn-helix domain-containing protein [Candidatus Bathyarchaeia archaeon]
MKYRSRSEIVKTILEAASEGTSRTRLMYKSYLSYSQLKEYLETVQENGLIDYEVGRRCYRITPKGIRLLQLQNKLEEIAPINYDSIKNS